jgi:hypothetical protein
MPKNESEAVAFVRRELDEFGQAKYREILLVMYTVPKIQEVDSVLTAAGFETSESKLKALDPVFKKYK